MAVRLRPFALVVVALLLVGSLGVLAGAAELTNWALGANYTYSMAPHEGYPDSGGQLTDGVYGQAVYNDPAWVGHLRNDFRMITLDLGQVRPVQEIKPNFLQQFSVGAYFPKEVIAEVSQDGIIWTEVGFQTFVPEQFERERGTVMQVVFDGLNLEARYVRLTVLVDVWMFIDEIAVLGK